MTKVSEPRQPEYASNAANSNFVVALDQIDMDVWWNDNLFVEISENNRIVHFVQHTNVLISHEINH